MHPIDANIILRYSLQENEELNQQAVELIDNNVVYATTGESPTTLIKMFYILLSLLLQFLHKALGRVLNPNMSPRF